MTDAREIIAHQIPGSSAEVCFGLADAIIDRLTAAGFRILSPDEVDPVTLDRVAQFTKSDFQRDFESPIGWRDQFATAIRALGRKA